jgi:hypothetical protein
MVALALVSGADIDFLVVAPVAQVCDVAMELASSACSVERFFGFQNGAFSNR